MERVRCEHCKRRNGSLMSDGREALAGPNASKLQPSGDRPVFGLPQALLQVRVGLLVL